MPIVDFGNIVVPDFSMRVHNYKSAIWVAAEGRVQDIMGIISSLSGKDIISASLYLYQYNATPGTDANIKIHDVTGSWTESTLKWNNQPTSDYHIVTPMTFTSQDSANGWRQWDGLENLVTTWANDGKTNYGIMLEDDIYGNWAMFYSKECLNTNLRPYLVVTTAAPEPISSALFLLGGASLALLRKRKKA